MVLAAGVGYGKHRVVTHFFQPVTNKPKLKLLRSLTPGTKTATWEGACPDWV